jgi:hypothetical protein
MAMQLTQSLQMVYNARAIVYYAILASIKEEEPEKLIVSLFGHVVD